MERVNTECKIQYQHFEECDVKKGEYLLSDFYPYSRWRLNAGAEPKHFLELPSLKPIKKRQVLSNISNVGPLSISVRHQQDIPLPVCEPKRIKRKEKNGVTRKSASKGSPSQSKAPLSVSTNENFTAVSLSVNDISSHNISSHIYGSTATPESVISLLSPDVVNEEEHHITTPVEKLPSPCLLSLPSVGQLSILIDSAMFCDKDLPNVEICSETTKNQISLLAPEVVTLEKHHTIALAEKLLYPCLLNLAPDEGQPSVLIDSEIVSADRLLNYEMCLATSETQTYLPAPEGSYTSR
ncbi:hypothetical protein OUZ56_011401 [Daphnia magna]|uniref:Uncharacterized protein n=1 Tax=Daphnia magna TaxID=35525 RepID=A0ABQ9Z073_9CRUS|nr:hypothetical protein OUZ56_011401 [Daphnia magna]